MNRYPRFALALSGAGMLALLAACSGGNSAAPTYSAEIRRTAFGVPHIKANDGAGLGYGVGYAYAEDNLCLMADEIVTVNGERSKYFGPDARKLWSRDRNLQADYFYHLLNDAESVNAAWQKMTPEIQATMKGYAAGYNSYLTKTGVTNLPETCRNAAWVRKITELDMVKLMRRLAVEASSGQFSGALVAAAPPSQAGSIAADAADAAKAGPDLLNPAYWKRMREQAGSNAVALGKDATENGQGMLLGNPHFPWQGALRFYQLHLTIPGKLDVMGASLSGLPVVNIGFNRHFAWTHTTNTSMHFTLYRLQLDAADPTKYIVDGQSKSMSKKTVSVEVRNADGTLTTRTHDFYNTQFGPIAVLPGQLDWSRTSAYALRDANLDNHRMAEQWYAMNRATTLDEFKGAIERIVGLPWVNTLATDKDGNTLYLDVSAVPNVSKAKQDACVPAPFAALAAQGILVLNGATAACEWEVDPAAPQPGIFAGNKLPNLKRADYVQNSNDSAWLSNPAAPLTGFPAIVSVDGSEQGGRTRIGISQLQARLDGSDGLGGKRMTLPKLQSIVLNNRVHYADLVMDDLLTLCKGNMTANAEDGTAVDLSEACATLARWDRSANLDANMGYAYFAGMMDRLQSIPRVWAHPFDAADPVNTPRGLNLADAGVTAALRGALASSVRAVNRQGWSAAAKWGEIQLSTRGAKKIPIHGGAGDYGIYNAIYSIPMAGGLLEVVDGSSYIQTVMFDRDGPRAQGFLTYSQSSNPASPYYADQTERFSKKEWINQAFTEAQITGDAHYSTTSISE